MSILIILDWDRWISIMDAAAAKAKFEIAKDEMGRRDYSEYVYIARAYMNADKP
jgi:hypothetical protein